MTDRLHEMPGTQAVEPAICVGPFTPPARLLLGPGPSHIHPRVLCALSTPVIGHLDPAFLGLLDETQSLLRLVFQTDHPFTLALSGSGTAGMEAVMVNLIEPDDMVVIGVNGSFGARLATIGERCGAKVIPIEAPWGEIIDPDAVRRVLARSAPVKLVAMVHAETSTGVWQPLEEIGSMCHNAGALFVVDAVTSLAGIAVEIDRWHIDACYSGTQKCLSCPPGLSPITLSPRALTAARQRRNPCPSWYLDFALIADYWEDSKRRYHHTAPVSMLYALHEALRLVLEEGLEARFERHRLHSHALLAGLSTMNLTPLPAEQARLPMLTCVTVPNGIDDQLVRTRLLHDHGIEIGGGLGPLHGKVWRLGLMGESAQTSHVLTFLQALESILRQQGWRHVAGEAVAAASAAYTRPRPRDLERTHDG